MMANAKIMKRDSVASTTTYFVGLGLGHYISSNSDSVMPRPDRTTHCGDRILGCSS